MPYLEKTLARLDEERRENDCRTSVLALEAKLKFVAVSETSTMLGLRASQSQKSSDVNTASGTLPVVKDLGRLRPEFYCEDGKSYD